MDLETLALVDGHCHPVVSGPVDDTAFESWCTESSSAPPTGVSYLDSQMGQAVRRWCSPVLGLAANASFVDYFAARKELTTQEVTTRLLRAANLKALLVDTGLPADGMFGWPVLAEAAGAAGAEVVRLEAIAERVVDGTTASGFASAFTAVLGAAVSAGAVATKSILAYRSGLDIEPWRPTSAEVAAAAGVWLRNRGVGRGRLTDPVLLRFLLWSAVDAGLPVQIHTGFGDADATVRGSDPGLLQRFCAASQAVGTPLVLLHCYPFHRNAGWLAHVYPHVYVDVGLTISHVGARARAVLGEFLELAPFGKVLYSSDAYGLPELFVVGAAQFRHSLGAVLAEFVADGAMTQPDAQRLAAAVGADNASRLYRLRST